MSDTPRTDALSRNSLNSHDTRAWMSLADKLERLNAELLTALKLAHDHLALLHEDFHGSPSQALAQIRAVINKAEGAK